MWLWDLLQLHEVSFAVLFLLLLLFIIIIVDIIGLQVPTRNLWEFTLSHVSPFSKHFRTARCATSSNYIWSDLDVFRRQIITLSKFGIFTCSLLWDAIIIYVHVIVFVLFILNVCPWLMCTVICVCTLCSVCNWPSCSSLGTSMTRNKFELVIDRIFYVHNKTQLIRM